MQGPSLSEGRAADSVMRAAGLVEERMGEGIGVREMAEAACYSPFYFSRLFARATGHAPYDYLMRRRVAASAAEVVGGSRSLIDIALDYGFDVPDTFARAFRRCFGSSPSDIRKSGTYPRATARTPIDRPYVEAMLLYGPPLPEAVEPGGATLIGSWRSGPEEAASAIEEALAASAGSGGGPEAIVFERDGELRPQRAFVGNPAAAPAAPRYPLSATVVPGGRGARFEVAGGADGLGFVVEFAYRAWLPSTGRAEPNAPLGRDRSQSAPAFDLVTVGEGGTLALVLPLG
jgi:AraC-like DNA-binding protein